MNPDALAELNTSPANDARPATSSSTDWSSPRTARDNVLLEESALSMVNQQIPSTSVSTIQCLSNVATDSDYPLSGNAIRADDFEVADQR
jgi:hypothetical protein